LSYRGGRITRVGSRKKGKRVSFLEGGRGQGDAEGSTRRPSVGANVTLTVQAYGKEARCQVTGTLSGCGYSRYYILTSSGHRFLVRGTQEYQTLLLKTYWSGGPSPPSYVSDCLPPLFNRFHGTLARVRIHIKRELGGGLNEPPPASGGKSSWRAPHIAGTLAENRIG